MTRAMWFAFLLRSDIRAGAAPADQEAQREFVVWWMLWGETEYPAVWHWDIAQAQVAMQLVSVGSDLPCPRLLRRLHASRRDLRAAFCLPDTEDLIDFFCWYRVRGVAELIAAPELPASCVALTECPSRRPFWSAGGLQVPRIALALAHCVPNLLSPHRFDRRRTPGRIVDWYQEYGRNLVPTPSKPPAPAATIRPGKYRQPGGVNLVGFVRGQSGLGEDVRMASLALDAADIPHVLVDVATPSAIPQGDNALAHRLTDRLVHGISIYCMSAFDMATLYLDRGPAFFSERYRIGYWPWELPRFPALWDQAFSLVDEIWTGSEYTARAYRARRSRPVRRLPCPVTLPRVQSIPRRDLALYNNDAFVFVYPFDVNSYLARKNPLALVRAFRRAFPSAQRDVALLLRVNGDPNGHPGWLEVAAECSADDRITILAGTFDRPKALGVIAACDCLVSPHRAEGFGRNIAEAILLGIPVLATEFSGCTDFLAPEEGIPFEIMTVQDGSYPFAEGQCWAEPSIDKMARRMQQIRLDRRNNPAAVQQRLISRRSEIAEAYSPHTTGRAFAKRLRLIERQMLPASAASRQRPTRQ